MNHVFTAGPQLGGPEARLHGSRHPRERAAGNVAGGLARSDRWSIDAASRDYWLPINTRPHPPRPPSIADGIEDLLGLLTPPRRLGMIAWLSQHYYEGWRPGREEVADLVAVELGLLTIDAYSERKSQRRIAEDTVSDITSLMRARRHRYPVP